MAEPHTGFCSSMFDVWRNLRTWTGPRFVSVGPGSFVVGRVRAGGRSCTPAASSPVGHFSYRDLNNAHSFVENPDGKSRLVAACSQLANICAKTHQSIRAQSWSETVLHAPYLPTWSCNQPSTCYLPGTDTSALCLRTRHSQQCRTQQDSWGTRSGRLHTRNGGSTETTFNQDRSSTLHPPPHPFLSCRSGDRVHHKALLKKKIITYMY